MSPTAVIVTILAYFAAILIISYFTGRKTDNAGFFSGNRKQSWYLVAFAMISASMSGVTYVSVPGMVASTGFGYMQMAFGFIAGQLVIAFVLIPLYYKMNLVSIYGYLENRFGISSYKTGAWFFFISKMLGASVRLFLVCLALQLIVFGPLGIPFAVNVAITIVILILYTFKGGVKSVIWIDTFKTICMLTSIVLCTVFIAKELGLSFGGILSTVTHNDMSRIFFFDDPNNPEYFFKQFFGGMFTVIAMTGMDQDMMQRSLTCKNYKDSQKNIITSTIIQTFVILLFLILGELLYIFAAANGITETGDKLFPAVATGGALPLIVGILFIIGLVACAYSAGGSALTALTTSFTVDILNTSHKSETEITSTRKKVHLLMAVGMGIVIYVFNLLNNTSAIDAVYKLASYTYGPILGLFTFGILSKRTVSEKWVPLTAIIAPVLCFILQTNSARWFGGYKFSYELLIFNALFTYLGLLIISHRPDIRK
ncbi:MAG: sodium:solute symporter [Bacteroidales bacterium]|jgi:Na+/proline symporter|nr:sodium:solute symporter [Bacteroidales bacterium]MCI1786404.1 sodium:solute symporter [Bacteroidales bacterium]